MKFTSALNELLFPQRCISCGVLGLSLCSQCRRGWNPHLYSHYIQHKSAALHVISSVPYSSTAQRIILAAKESGIRAADELVIEAITHSVRNFLARERIEILVPVPSRRSASRKRGRKFIDVMSGEVAQQLSLTSNSLLTHQRRVSDQSKLDHHQRWNNLEGSLVVEDGAEKGARALLIDDLVTTGATLLEASRALGHAGIEVVGAATAALVITSKIT